MLIIVIIIIITKLPSGSQRSSTAISRVEKRMLFVNAENTIEPSTLEGALGTCRELRELNSKAAYFRNL